ncbi:hypothetical protein H1R17_11235 [Flavobacterium sp. xlx-214]|uniref:hypothetical protein n=1 Tax=unclassified Flavobacterium TaxID=196869 RepID=UPI0013D19089|nr:MULTISPECIES: hypothetical protein [unclassified Flavobacterium]MBA5791788.1 hypothetical protein [Flavobacterium sp. xlx-221]QMI83027.1 hypothetical protein H1R17_11235 [Flavobacterium sp. xlx-214]
MKKAIKMLALVGIGIVMPKAHAQENNQLYMGPGIGLDYGGIGAKIEYLPIKNIGVFAGLGYNLLGIGWNVGATYKIMPTKKVSVNPMVFYGYNGGSKVNGLPDYDMISYGVTAGVNIDFKMGKKGNKLSAGVFVPFRSQKFMDNYDAMKNDYRVVLQTELLPIAVGVGYNFRLN